MDSVLNARSIGCLRKPELVTYLLILVKADSFVILTEALTTEQQVVLADNGVTIHATAAATTSSTILLRMSVPQMIGHYTPEEKETSNTSNRLADNCYLTKNDTQARMACTTTNKRCLQG